MMVWPLHLPNSDLKWTWIRTKSSTFESALNNTEVLHFIHPLNNPALSYQQSKVLLLTVSKTLSGTWRLTKHKSEPKFWLNQTLDLPINDLWRTLRRRWFPLKIAVRFSQITFPFMKGTTFIRLLIGQVNHQLESLYYAVLQRYANWNDAMQRVWHNETHRLLFISVNQFKMCKTDFWIDSVKWTDWTHSQKWIKQTGYSWFHSWEYLSISINQFRDLRLTLEYILGLSKD